ncbi:MAG: N-acetyltransferase family protein [Verrucomicrobiota bacterium]
MPAFDPTVVEIRAMQPHDWPAVRKIYEQGIATGQATFETAAPSWDEWDSSHFVDLRLVADEDSGVIGWAALSPVSHRACYAGVAEGSVYVAEGARRRGVGTGLLDRLLADADEAGFWTIQTSIFPENDASIALHTRCGFRVVGTRERIARLDGTWRDTVLLERRVS